jgi:subfamily B ATP-binding cassette protein MsbA
MIPRPPPSPRPRLRELLSGGPLRFLGPRVRPHAGALALATLTLLGASAIGLVFPMVVGKLLDSAFVERDGGMLDRIAATLMVLFVVQAVMTFVQHYLLGSTGERVTARLRRDLFEHLLALPPAFFAERRTGELTSRLGNDTGQLQALLSSHVSEMVREVLSLVGAVTLLFITHPRLALVTLAVVPFVVGTAFFFGRRLKNSSLGVMDQVAEASAIAEEALSQIRVVQSFTGEPFEVRRYEGRMQSAVAVAIRRAATRGLFFSVIGFVTLAASVLVLWLGGKMVLAGELTAGTLVTFLLYAASVASSVGGIGHLWSAYQEATGAAGRVFEILGSTPALRDPDRPVALPRPVRGALALEDVWFRYEPPAELPGLLRDAAPAPSPVTPEWTLRGLTLNVRPGETVALVGPSGAGKTTVVSLVPRFYDPQRGRVTLDGVDLRELGLHDLRGAIGMVPQETLLFSGTIRENIAYGRPGASPEEVLAAARGAHAHEFIDRLPERYDTVVGERGVKLSGGQRQRIALARALLKDPAVLILDEATSNLDAESEALIEDALEHLLAGRTTIIIAHRLSTVRRADRLVVLDGGTIVQEGTHAELLAAGGLYARLYARQFREDDAPSSVSTEGGEGEAAEAEAVGA